MGFRSDVRFFRDRQARRDDWNTRDRNGPRDYIIISLLRPRRRSIGGRRRRSKGHACFDATYFIFRSADRCCARCIPHDDRRRRTSAYKLVGRQIRHRFTGTCTRSARRKKKRTRSVVTATLQGWPGDAGHNTLLFYLVLKLLTDKKKINKKTTYSNT